MKKYNLASILVIGLVFCFACSQENSEDSKEIWKNEIVKTEQAFAEKTSEIGISAAFLEFAAEDAVVKRGKNLIIGKKALKESYNNSQPNISKVSLTWKPDFVDVSTSGDLGYTYGKYIYTQTDSSGIAQIDSGVFHTVWKRQVDGNWKFVFRTLGLTKLD